MCTGKRMKQRRKELGIKAEEMAEVLGCSRSTIFRYENGDIEKIPSSLINMIAKVLKTTPSYLVGWSDAPTPQASNIIALSETKKIPLLGTIACGEPVLAVENTSNFVDITTDIHADFALRCKGDSMINARIFDGDIVYIRKQDTVENGEIAAVLINELETEATLKQVYTSSDSIRLCAANPMYPDKIFVKEKMNDVRIIGKAVAFLSSIK